MSWSFSSFISFTARSLSVQVFTSLTFSSSSSLNLASSSRILASFFSFEIYLYTQIIKNNLLIGDKDMPTLLF